MWQIHLKSSKRGNTVRLLSRCRQHAAVPSLLPGRGAGLRPLGSGASAELTVACCVGSEQDGKIQNPDPWQAQRCLHYFHISTPTLTLPTSDSPLICVVSHQYRNGLAFFFVPPTHIILITVAIWYGSIPRKASPPYYSDFLRIFPRVTLIYFFLHAF